MLGLTPSSSQHQGVGIRQQVTMSNPDFAPFLGARCFNLWLAGPDLVEGTLGEYIYYYI